MARAFFDSDNTTKKELKNMAGTRDFVNYVEDFFGGQTVGTSLSEGALWKITDTSSSGTPTYGVVDGSATGEYAIAHSNTNEVQNVCLNFGDVLCFGIDNLQSFAFRVKANASYNAASSLAFGLQGDRNDAIDSIAQHASFRLIGSNSIFVETDDGTTDIDDKATGQSLAAAYKWFVIDFTGGKSNVKFYVDGVPVAKDTVFDMSAYSGSLQPYVQLQKTAATSTDSVTIDLVEWQLKR
jgi:hypothetical protein